MLWPPQSNPNPSEMPFRVPGLVSILGSASCLMAPSPGGSGSGASCGGAGGSSNGAGQKGSGKRRRKPWGLALWDAANINCTFHEILGGRRPTNAERINVGAVRRELWSEFSVKRFLYFVRHDPARDRRHLKAHLAQNHLKLIEARRETRSNRCAVDVAIIDRIQAARSTFGFCGPSLICLASHDGDYTEACNAWLDCGGRLILLGFVQRFARRLYQLSDHPRCVLLDLRYNIPGACLREVRPARGVACLQGQDPGPQGAGDLSRDAR